MTDGGNNTPMAWRYCGSQLKLWREQAGVSREDLGAEAGYGYEHVKSMELGRRRPTLRLLQVADQMCGAKGMLLAAHEYLAPERFLSYAQDFVRYEAEAIVVSSYETQLIPGLLQTEAYARALMSTYCPPLDDDTIETRVRARMERQVVLDTQTRAFSFVIGEAPLRYPAGLGATHRGQLGHLLEVGDRRNVTVQVLPFGSPAQPGCEGPFVLLETPEHQRVAYEEGQMAGVLYSEPDKVSVLAQRHAMILRQALSPEESARFIRKLAEEL